MCEQPNRLENLLPATLPEWQISERDHQYGPRNLYEYIDGGAELYLSYGFIKMMNRIYSAENQPDILVDLFDMGDSRNAYGVFTHARETEDGLFGQGSQVVPGLVVFWKDRYFASILATPETPESRKAMFRIAKTIDDAIEVNGPSPAVISRLPGEHLISESIRFFTHPIWLNSYGFIADGNLFFIDEETEAVLAKYETQDRRTLLLLVLYPDEHLAESALTNFKKVYLKSQNASPVMRIEDGSWTGYKRSENLVAVIFDAPDEKTPTAILQGVR